MAVAKTPDEYVASLNAWAGECVQYLRKHVKTVAGLSEEIKWGHLVYSSNGPVLYIRAAENRVMFGFWRGRQLREIEPALQASGKYDMAKIEFRSTPYPTSSTIEQLVREAISLNARLGNPQDAAKK